MCNLSKQYKQHIYIHYSGDEDIGGVPGHQLQLGGDVEDAG